MEKITILTAPSRYSFFEKIGFFYIKRKQILSIEEKLGYGPSSVLRSLLNGFSSLKIRYNLNPKNIQQIGDTVVVLSNIEALRQAIDLKKRKKIKYLLAGPNLVVFSSDFHHIIASPEIDVCLVPSEQVTEAYVKDTPILNNRIEEWYAGVDESYWKPNRNHSLNRNVLIYNKNSSSVMGKKVAILLKKYSWNPIYIKYGCYTHEEFKASLRICRFAIFLSRIESQGISLAESWAMDVPTIVWNPKVAVVYGRTFDNISSAPYLSSATGKEWKKIGELEKILKSIKIYLKRFKSRQWVLNNMTDRKSAGLLLKIIKSINN